MRRMQYQVSALALAITTGGAFAGQVLRFQGKAGDAAVYQMAVHGKTTIQQGKKRSDSRIGSEVYLTQRVAAVSEDGVQDLVTTVDSAQTLHKGERKASALAGRKSRSKLHPNGVTTNESAAEAALAVSQLQLVFPDEPVQVGSTWSRVLPPSQAVPISMKSTYKVVGFERRGDHECVRIATKIRSVGKPSREQVEISMQADGTIYFAYDQGFLVDSKVDASLKMAFSQAKEAKVQDKVNIETKMTATIGWQYADSHGD